MPKAKLSPESLPTWDELVAELGDPRPYEPTAIVASLAVPDDLLADELIDLVDALNDVEAANVDALLSLDRLTLAAQVVLDETFPLDDVDDALVRRERWRAARADDTPTAVLPVWPGDDAEEPV